MIDAPEIVTTKAHPAAIIRMTIPKGEIRMVMGPAMQELMGTVMGQKVQPAGRIFSHHLRSDPKVFDFEVGIAVSTPVTPAGRVTMGELPARKVIRTTYHGGYEGLGAAWGEFLKAIEQQGTATTGEFWEIYQVGPESGPDESKWATELCRVVA